MRDFTVCHVISGDVWGGAETQALELIRGLSAHANVCAVLFNRGELSHRLAEYCISVDLMDEAHSGILSLAINAHRLLKKRPVDLVHVHGFKEHLVAGAVARWLDIPIVRTYHGRGLIGGGWRYSYIERFNASLLSDRAIAVSEDLLLYLRRKGIPQDKIRIIRNGVPPDIAGRLRHGDPKASVRSQAFHVGTVGRLVAVKNHRCLLEAFRRVRDEISNARLTIVGDGPLAEPLRSHASALGIADCVDFTGFQQDVDAFLTTFDTFVLPSLHEGIPIALLEAMRAKVPVVCTRVGGMPEVVSDQHSGLLVEPDDTESLAEAILRLAADRDLGRRLAANAQRELFQELSFDRCLSRTLSLYEDCAGMHWRRGSAKHTRREV